MWSAIYSIFHSGGSKAISTYEDIEAFRQATGCRSVMLARAALWNYSIFRKDGKLPIVDVLREYLKYVSSLSWYNLNQQKRISTYM